MKIALIVDDDPSNRKSLSRVIACLFPGTVILESDNGDHAWNTMCVGGHEVDVIISDVDMPKMNGVKLIEKIREAFPEIRLVLMSGNPEPENHRADYFLHKPFKISELKEKIEDRMSI